MAPNLGAVDESGAEVLLDEISTPDGPFELVAHRRETVWIGIRRKGWPRVDGSATQSAIGLHTGSAEHYVEASVSIHGTWGLAYGGVSPEVERVAVRNERREVFPARIIRLPPPFEEEYRAAWGVATDCGMECELIGYDRHGRLIAPDTVRTGERRVPSAAESLELNRQHCDSGLRYYARALKTMPSIPEQAEHVGPVRNSLHALALVLAYVEGAQDEPSAMSEAREIVLRYVASD